MTLTPQNLLSNIETAVNLLTSVSKVDIVGILSQSTTISAAGAVNTAFSQIFSEARPMKGTVKETSKVMDYPVENGAIYSDHKVINPTEIEFLMIIPQEAYSTAYPAIRNAWLNSDVLAVQTRTGTYRNMIIQDMPHEEEPDIFSAITIFVRMREAIQQGPAGASSQLSNYSPAQPQDAVNVNTGLLSGIPAAGSVLGLFNASSVWGLS